MGGQRLQIGADDRADPACLRGPGDLCRRGFALAQILLEALERDGETYLAAMAEAVRNSLRYAEHLYRYSFNHMGFVAVGKQVIREMQHTERPVTRLRRPVVPAGCHPHLLRMLIWRATKG